MTQKEKDKLYNVLCRLVREIDQLQDIPFSDIADKTRKELDFLINPVNH